MTTDANPFTGASRPSGELTKGRDEAGDLPDLPIASLVSGPNRRGCPNLLFHISACTSRRALMLYACNGLLLVSALCVFVTYAQADKLCEEAASLWIPSQTSREKSVVKWSRPIKYGIIAGDDDRESRSSIEEIVQFIWRESGLQIEADYRSALDLTIAVPADISSAASGARTFVEAYFQDVLAKKGLKGTIRFDPAVWEPQYRSVTPKCAGPNLTLGGVIERAFVLVQKAEARPCVEVALGEVFGLINIRTYYVDHDREIPSDLIARALRALYDGRVRAGVSQSDANKAVGEICK